MKIVISLVLAFSGLIIYQIIIQAFSLQISVLNSIFNHYFATVRIA